MKRSCVLLALLLLAVLAMPAFAAENEFVPSITYKDGPEIEKAQQEKEDVTPCLVVTSIIQAKNKDTDIHQEDRELLLEVYEKLKKNEMQLTTEDEDLVIRELIDLSWRKTDCVEENHNHKQWLTKEDTAITVTFKTGIPSTTDVVVMVYINEQWVPVETKVNKDKTITCTFEEICPVAICVREKQDTPPAQTGDALGRMLWIWVLLLVTSLGALTALVMSRRKFLR